ncbi:hypothetical protein KLP28_17195 [Nocardioidaceae bacterium]|nr:hypothetical protein KLP28_17195 [Nocardioidaceae bacterium]
MTGDLLSLHGAIGAFGLSLVVFGFAPGLVLAIVVRLIPDLERRRELQAELYEVPRWEQPYWVAQQFEVAIRVGLFPQANWYWGRHVWHRCKIESGLESHRKWPASFWVPEDNVKAGLGPGDSVKLMWSVRRMPGERMWVTVTERKGDRLVGTLDNWAIFAFLHPDETVRFHIDDIIDYIWQEEGAEAA